MTLSLVTILSGCEINNFAGQSAKSVCYNLVAMLDLFRLWLGAVLRGFGGAAVCCSKTSPFANNSPSLSASNLGQGWEPWTNSSGS